MFIYASMCYIPFSYYDISTIQWTSISTVAILQVLYVVLGGSFLAYLCIMTAQRLLRPTVVSMYNYMQPIVATIAAIAMGIGFDKIFVETVGVGQSETAVHSMVDFFLLIQLSGTGDELQGIKRGIMEMADGIVINKADGDNLERAKLAATQFRNALHLFPAPESGWIPKVLTYSGFYNLGVKEVWDMIYEYIDFVKENGYFEYRRNEKSKYWMYESINEQLRDSLYHNPKIETMLLEKEQQVLKGNLTSFIAARSLLDTYFEYLK